MVKILSILIALPIVAVHLSELFNTEKFTTFCCISTVLLVATLSCLYFRARDCN